MLLSRYQRPFCCMSTVLHPRTLMEYICWKLIREKSEQKVQPCSLQSWSRSQGEISPETFLWLLSSSRNLWQVFREFVKRVLCNDCGINSNFISIAEVGFFNIDLFNSLFLIFDENSIKRRRTAIECNLSRGRKWKTFEEQRKNIRSNSETLVRLKIFKNL